MKNYEMAKQGAIPTHPKFYSGTSKLNKTETKESWEEFGGDKHAYQDDGGNGIIVRITERISKKTGISIQFTEKLTRYSDGYGCVDWRFEIKSMPRREPVKHAFDENWKPAILAKIREIVFDGISVSEASKALAVEFGVPFSTMRPNIWIAKKWADGETSNFLPHRSMIKPIVVLFCELGKKNEVLSSLSGYCSLVSKPSEHVLTLLKDLSVEEVRS